MPYPNEHACRVKEPSNYTQFARKQIAPGISMILGIKNGKSETQAYRFNIKNYTVQAAHKWLDDHNITCTEFAGATGVKAKKSSDEIMAVSNTPWSQFKDSDYTDEQYKRAALVCDAGCLKNSTPKSCCKLPVREPSGALNSNGLKAAWGALQGGRGGVNLSPELRSQALSKIKGLYQEAGLKGLGPLKARNSLMAKGTIWKTGKHHVFVNGQPASVFEPQHKIPETFKVFQDEINRNGGITLGLDHIPDELLKEYPLLAKMNPLDVGRITRIAHDNDAIYALESEHTNPLIQQLYDAGELPAYSIVADFNASPCETGQADYIIESFKNIKRTDYVDEGGCTDCKVGEDLPDDLVMTAKLSLTEDDNLSDDIELVEEVPQEELIEAETTEEEVPTEEEVVESEEITEEEVEEEEEEESMESRMAKVEDAIAILAKKSEAVDEIQLQAKTSRVTGLIDAEIKAGKVLPKERDSLISYGVEREAELKEMLAARPVVVELDEQKSVHIDAKHGNKEYTYEDFEKEYKKE